MSDSEYIDMLFSNSIKESDNLANITSMNKLREKKQASKEH
jgi:hypothetical protein